MSDPAKLYDDVVMDHIKNARNFRPLGEPALRAEGLNVLCGDALTVYVRVEGERLGEVGFQCECCGISMASASIMTEAIAGRTRPEAQALHQRVVAAIQGHGEPPADVPALIAIVAAVKVSPARRRCALLPWATLDAVLSGRSHQHV
jgi:nitrogen fixation NifU-like protein